MKNENSYIALHASALAGRSLVEQDRLEEAEKVLQPLAKREKDLIDKTFLEAEVDFLLAYCLLANLRYDEAYTALKQFDMQHPNAPDRLRLPTRQMLQELQARRPGGLGDVSDLMTYAGRRLAVGDPGEPVQVRQAEAVDILSKLIEEAEQRECGKKSCKNCGGKGCKKCGGSGTPKGNQPPNSPAQKSVLPLGPGRMGELQHSPDAQPGEFWGKMRPEQREKILQSLRKNFPAQYRQLVEQYYKQLAKEK
jgi:tetratricopeptide (TPR) repeat protein